MGQQQRILRGENLSYSQRAILDGWKKFFVNNYRSLIMIKSIWAVNKRRKLFLGLKLIKVQQFFLHHKLLLIIS